MQVVCCKQLHGWNGIRELSGKWLNCVVQPHFFLSLTSQQPNVIFLAVRKRTQTKNVLRCQIPKILKGTLYYAKHGVCQNSASHRKPLHLTLRIEGSDSVTNRAVLVSFHKQHCIFFSVKNANVNELTNLGDLICQYSVNVRLFLS